MDCLGAAESPKDYVVAGTAATEMHGCAEALWHESMEAEELFECVSQTLLSGCDRNAASGKPFFTHRFFLTSKTNQTSRLGRHSYADRGWQDNDTNIESPYGLDSADLQVHCNT